MLSSVIVLVGSLTLAGNQARAQVDDLAALLRQAQEDLQAGRALEAEQQFRRIAGVYPFLLGAHRGVAEALVEQGKRRQAAGVLVAVGAQLQRAGRTGDARDFLEAAIEADDDVPAAHHFLGAVMMDEADFVSAVEQFEIALGVGDTQTATRLSLASALWETGRFEESEHQYRAALEADSGDPVVLHQLGSLLLWQGRYEEALPVLELAAERAAANPGLLIDLGRARDGAGDLAGALEANRRAVALAPTDTRARYQLGSLLARVGERSAAESELAEYRRLRRLQQDRDRAAARLQADLDEATELLRQGDAPGATTIFRRLPETAETLDGLAAALAARGDHAGAVRALERALTLQPQRRDLQLTLARERLAARERQ